MQNKLETINAIVRRALTQEHGVTAIEYGLLAALIAITCIGAWAVTGASLERIYIDWSGAVSAAL